MNESAIRIAMAEAHRCASVLLESATYIQNELPNVRLSNALRAQAEQVCTTLVGTQHDISSELAEMAELLGSSASASAIGARMARLVQWVRDDIAQMHQLVAALDSASKRDPACGPAHVLVAESAVNVVRAFGLTRAAADALRSDGGEPRNA